MPPQLPAAQGYTRGPHAPRAQGQGGDPCSWSSTPSLRSGVSTAPHMLMTTISAQFSLLVCLPLSLSCSQTQRWGPVDRAKAIQSASWPQAGPCDTPTLAWPPASTPPLLGHPVPVLAPLWYSISARATSRPTGGQMSELHHLRETVLWLTWAVGRSAFRSAPGGEGCPRLPCHPLQTKAQKHESQAVSVSQRAKRRGGGGPWGTGRLGSSARWGRAALKIK